MANIIAAEGSIYSTVGRIASEPELRYTPGGDPVVQFRMAVPLGYGNEAETLWFDVATWNEGTQADLMAEAGKGSEIAVRGKLSSREYNGKTYFKITAHRLWIVQALAYTPREKKAEEVLPF